MFAITLVGGRHVFQRVFEPYRTLLTMGKAESVLCLALSGFL